MTEATTRKRRKTTSTKYSVSLKFARITPDA